MVTHWTCFDIKEKKLYYFDSVLEVVQIKFYLKQLPKPIIYHNFIIQHINSNLCGSCCFYFFLSNGKNKLL